MIFIDMHCHLLHGVDDGSQSLEESIAALNMAEEQGVSEIILTPHFQPEKPVPVKLLRERFEELKKAAEDDGLDIKLHLGQECLYHTDLVNRLDAGDALTLADSDYVLVEFLTDVSYKSLIRGLDELMDNGYLPILAHYERYGCLSSIDKVEEVKHRGTMLQINSNTLLSKGGLFRKNPYHRDMKLFLPDFVASDCHGATWRSYNLPPVFDWMENNLSEGYMEALLQDNPMRVLNNIY